MPKRKGDIITSYSYISSSAYFFKSNDNIKLKELNNVLSTNYDKKVNFKNAKYDRPLFVINETKNMSTQVYIEKRIGDKIQLYLSGGGLGEYISYVLLDREIIPVMNNQYVMWRSLDKKSTITLPINININDLSYGEHELVVITIPTSNREDDLFYMFPIYGSDKVNLNIK